MNHFETRSDFDIVYVNKDKVFIVDLDLGNTSVTNDAESVYIYLKKIYPKKRIIYRDTLLNWDEIKMVIVGAYPYNVKFKRYEEDDVPM